jgi:hypothetical protein
MITFKQYLREEEERQSRVAPIEVDYAVKWMENYAEDYLKKGVFLFRGAGGQRHQGVTHGDASHGAPRKSANTANYYTLWMDNHPDWKGLPRRGNAFITTTNPEQAARYGEQFIVIPKDDAKIGLVKTPDIWATKIDDTRLLHFNEMTQAALEFLELNDYPTSFAELRDSLKQASVSQWDDKLRAKGFRGPPATLVDMMNRHKVDNLFDLWEKLVTPSLYDFATGGNLPTSTKGEVWVDGEALFIPVNQSSISATDQFEILDWSKENAPKLHKLLVSQFWIDEPEDEEDGRVEPDKISAADALTHTQRRSRG